MDGIEAMIAKFQQTSMRLRYSARADGRRRARHGARRLVRIHAALRPAAVAALKRYIGLPEVGVDTCRRARAARNSPCARPKR